MRSGGFPCRFGGCDVRYAVLEEGSMPALLAASEKRTEHEVSAHDYRHVRPPEATRLTPPFAVRPKGVKGTVKS